MLTPNAILPAAEPKQDADYVFYELTRSICPTCRLVIDGHVLIRDNKVYASWDKTAGLWDAATGQARATLAHQLTVTAVVFSPDGRTVATASWDKTAGLWDAATGQARATLAHQLIVTAVAFSPDGRTVATASWDKTARLWDAATGQTRATLALQDTENAVAFSPDGRFLLVASGYNAQFYLYRPADLIQAACDYLPFNMSLDVWKLYLPEEPYRKTCPNVRD